ncbi:hypothetical protein P3L10_023660 [Capsicum annuum]
MALVSYWEYDATDGYKILKLHGLQKSMNSTLKNGFGGNFVTIQRPFALRQDMNGDSSSPSKNIPMEPLYFK